MFRCCHVDGFAMLNKMSRSKNVINDFEIISAVHVRQDVVITVVPSLLNDRVYCIIIVITYTLCVFLILIFTSEFSPLTTLPPRVSLGRR